MVAPFVLPGLTAYQSTVLRSFARGFLGQATGLARFESLLTSFEQRRFVQSLGPAGRLVVDLADENERLRVEISRLQVSLPHFRPLKRRSPAEWRFRVTRWELIDMPIRPREQAGPIVIRALRLHVPLEDKPEGEPYWDITGRNLIESLLPVLPKLAGSGRYLHIKKRGEGFGSFHRVSLERSPPPAT